LGAGGKAMGLSFQVRRATLHQENGGGRDNNEQHQAGGGQGQKRRCEKSRLSVGDSSFGITPYPDRT